MSMYIRLKRKDQTIFLHVEPSNNFGQIKQRITEILGVKDASRIMLIANDRKKELVDLATVSDQEIKNDDIVFMVFAKETGGGWEEIQVDTHTTFGDDGNSQLSAN